MSSNDDEFLKNLLIDAENELKSVAQDNLGMSMIFALVAALQDILNREIENRSAEALKIERKKKEIADRLERVQFEGEYIGRFIYCILEL